MFTRKSASLALAVITFAIFSSVSTAAAPQADRLIGISDTVVTIADLPGGMFGIATDGRKVYVRSTTYRDERIYETNFDGTGTVEHEVTNFPTTVTTEQSNLALSHGCIWSSSHSGELFCTSTSTWTANQVAVPSDHPLPGGQWWMYSNLLDFPDGRIGRVSPQTDDNSSLLRTYNVIGTGNSATITWSEDFILADTGFWIGDDHGIATDGVYVYRIVCCESRYKSWKLVSGAPSPVSYDGTGDTHDDGVGNATYITHDHVHSRYLIGDYSNNRFYMTTSQNPGVGPGVTTTTTTTTTTVAPTTTTSVAPTTTVRVTTTSAPTATTVPVALEIVVNASVATVPSGQASVATIAPSKFTNSSASTTTTVSSAKTTTAPTSPPVPTSTIPNISSTPPGKASVIINGSNSPASVSRDQNQLVITSGELKATVGSVNGNGTVGSLDQDGNISLRPGSLIRIRVSGLAPNSVMEAWLFSKPRRLGNARTDANGALTATFTIPEDTPNGDHRVAIVAKMANGKDATFALGIKVNDLKSSIDVPTWLIVTPLVMSIGVAMFLPPALRKRKRKI